MDKLTARNMDDSFKKASDNLTKANSSRKRAQNRYRVKAGIAFVLHQRPEFLEDLRTPVHRSRRRRTACIPPHPDVEPERPHIQHHPSNVQHRGEQEHASPPKNRRHDHQHQLLHQALLRRPAAAGALVPAVAEPRRRGRRGGGAAPGAQTAVAVRHFPSAASR